MYVRYVLLYCDIYIVFVLVLCCVCCMYEWCCVFVVCLEFIILIVYDGCDTCDV